MNPNKKISVVIVDDDPEAIFNLESFLEMIPQVKIAGKATGVKKALKLIKDNDPDLVFMETDETGKHLLEEFEQQKYNRNFGIIFHSAYDSLNFESIKDSALDYVMKPPREEDIQRVITKFLQNKSHSIEKHSRSGDMAGQGQLVALPTTTGLQFVNKSEIVFAECRKNSSLPRPVWFAGLSNQQTIRLRQNISASDIINHLGPEQFIGLSQSFIVNISFINNVEYKTRLCYLFAPHIEQPIKVSRNYLAELRERFDVL